MEDNNQQKSPVTINMAGKTDLLALAASVKAAYFNKVVSSVNDHVVRIGIMTEPYRWHFHPNSDETFIGLEGTVIIEIKLERFELTPGSCVTIPKNIVHRTFPVAERSVNLTLELSAMETIFEEES